MSLIMRECDFKYTFHNAESSESIAATKERGISLILFLSLSTTEKLVKTFRTSRRHASQFSLASLSLCLPLAGYFL